MADWLFTLPFLCSLLWAIGGREGGRYFRRIGVGLAVGFYGYMDTHNLVCFLAIFMYWIITSVGYGKLIAKRNWIVLCVLGCFYGLASFSVCCVTGSELYLFQGAISAGAFPVMVWLSNKKGFQVHWAISEGFTGLAATILVPRMIIA